jgi:ketosteroid isomerase-like protein
MTDDRLEQLERRLCHLDDQHTIQRLIASYGPLVDAGEADAVAQLWTVDGVYDIKNEGWFMQGRNEVAAMVHSATHQELIGRGVSHFLGPAVVALDGDHAVAVCESVLLIKGDGDSGYRAARVGANHFRLRRIDGVWQVVVRVSRRLDGSDQARELLSAGIAGRSP